MFQNRSSECNAFSLQKLDQHLGIVLFQLLLLHVAMTAVQKLQFSARNAFPVENSEDLFDDICADCAHHLHFVLWL